MTERVWTTEWPTEPGDYWFYGWRSKFGFENRLSIRMALVRALFAGQTSVRSLIFVCEGGFMFEREGGRGKWASAELPEPPGMEEFDE